MGRLLFLVWSVISLGCAPPGSHADDASVVVDAGPMNIGLVDAGPADAGLATSCTDATSCALLDGGVGRCCQGACRSVLNDITSCGACGATCPSGSQCELGNCSTPCGVDAGLCPTGTACVNERPVCALTACAPTTEGLSCARADGETGVCCGNACVDLDSPSSCGGCCRTCSPAEACIGQVCRAISTCTPPTALGALCVTDAGPGGCCGGACINDFESDRSCGACGNVCPGDSSCTQARCLLADGGRADGCEGGCPLGTRCSGRVCLRETCVGSNDGEACAGGVCCQQQCTSLENSTAHCGACGNACAAGLFCDRGACRPQPGCTLANGGAACPLPDAGPGRCCEASCVDPANDAEHCGRCGASCPLGSRCEAQQCRTSDAGFPSCGATSCASGEVCGGGGRCLARACGPGVSGVACAFGLTIDGQWAREGRCCDGACVDLTQSPTSCSSCGARCSDGLCAPLGLGVCVPQQPERTCAMTCASGTFCANGFCEAVACGSFGGLCLQPGGTVGACCGFATKSCVDLRTDEQHCGGCDVRCPSGSSCVDGVCSGVSTCALGAVSQFCGVDGGLSVCCPGSGCSDLLDDELNCGSCGSRCPANHLCERGECRAPDCSLVPARSACSRSDGGLGDCCGASCIEYDGPC